LLPLEGVKAQRLMSAASVLALACKIVSNDPVAGMPFETLVVCLVLGPRKIPDARTVQSDLPIRRCSVREVEHADVFFLVGKLRRD